MEVDMGGLVVTKNADNLVTSGIGSCVAIALYDSKLKIAGLAHAMLPFSNVYNIEDYLASSKKESNDTRYIEIAINKMIEQMQIYGADKKNLEAKIIGGANMFPLLGDDIGKENISRAKAKLKKENIKIVGECIGGSIGRSVEFCAASGIVTVKTKF